MVKMFHIGNKFCLYLIHQKLQLWVITHLANSMAWGFPSLCTHVETHFFSFLQSVVHFIKIYKQGEFIAQVAL